MRIGFDAKRAFHNERGLGNYSRDLLRILHQYYPQNEYFLFNPKLTQKQLLQRFGSQTEINPTEAFYQLMPSLWRSYGMCKTLLQKNIEVYHGLSQELPWNINTLKVKTVVTFHDAIFMRHPELYPALYRHTFIRKNKYSLHAADKVIAISEQSKRDAIRFFKVPEQKIDVIYQGCNELFRQTYSHEKLAQTKRQYDLPDAFILSVGALEERKNLMTLLKAYALTKQTIPLVIVGRETKYAAHLKQQAAELNITKNILFLHQVATPDLTAIYQSATLFVFPSLFEGFGIPILEALCSKVPVITSSGSCFEETGGNAACYVDPLNTDELAAGIQHLIDHAEVRESMIEKGTLHAQNFTEDKIASRWINLYKSLL